MSWFKFLVFPYFQTSHIFCREENCCWITRMLSLTLWNGFHWKDSMQGEKAWKKTELRIGGCRSIASEHIWHVGLTLPNGFWWEAKTRFIRSSSTKDNRWHKMDEQIATFCFSENRINEKYGLSGFSCTFICECVYKIITVRGNVFQ